jgi:hypothetical protein
VHPGSHHHEYNPIKIDCVGIEPSQFVNNVRPFQNNRNVCIEDASELLNTLSQWAWKPARAVNEASKGDDVGLLLAITRLQISKEVLQ